MATLHLNRKIREWRAPLVHNAMIAALHNANKAFRGERVNPISGGFHPHDYLNAVSPPGTEERIPVRYWR